MFNADTATHVDLHVANRRATVHWSSLCARYVSPLHEKIVTDAPRKGYITYFLSLLNVSDFFTVSVVLYVVMLLSNLSAFLFIETAGRRILLNIGIVLLTVILLVMGIMGCIMSSATTWVILVCIFLW